MAARILIVVTVKLPNAFSKDRKEQKERERIADTIELSTGNNNRKNVSPVFVARAQERSVRNCDSPETELPRRRPPNVQQRERIRMLVRRSNDKIDFVSFFLFCYFLGSPDGGG